MSVLPGRMAPIPVGRLRGGLLSAARSLPASFDEWRQGVGFWSNCQSDVGLSVCVEPAEAPTKLVADDTEGSLVFEPFVTYAGRECSTWVDEDELRERARNGFDAQLSAAYAQQLQADAAGIGDGQNLNAVANDITPNPLADITNTLSGLISAIQCDCKVTDVTIHAPRRTIPFFVERRLVKWNSDTARYEMGDVVFSFDCYSETGPGEAGEAALDEAWLYATGPIEVDLAPDNTELVGTTHQRNERSVLVERLAILRFDPCCVTAAKAQLS